MSRIAIIDYGMGNLHSMGKAIERVSGGDHVFFACDPESLRRADRIVFPGVGAIAPCMAELQRLGLDEALRRAARSKPLLGVCLGMQALLEHSAESGGIDGLGLIPGHAAKLDARKAKVPHMGWNRVYQSGDHELWNGIPQDCMFYFVHSYQAVPRREADVAARTRHGGEPFVSAVRHENLFAVQFHPEKSQGAGLKLLANFLLWDPMVETAEETG